LSVSQAGYNTVGDILMAGCRALLIPFEGGGETEQADRALRLAKLNRAIVLPEADLTGPRLAQSIKTALTSASLQPTLSFQTDGASRTAEIVRNLYRKHKGA
jgi:predicted glycosyltransferase